MQYWKYCRQIFISFIRSAIEDVSSCISWADKAESHLERERSKLNIQELTYLLDGGVIIY